MSILLKIYALVAVSCLVTPGQSRFIHHGGMLDIALPNYLSDDHLSFVGSMNAFALGARSLAAIDAFKNDSTAVALVFSTASFETIPAPANSSIEASPLSKWQLGSVTKAFGLMVGYEESESKTLFKNIHDFSYTNPDYVPGGSSQVFGYHVENLVHPNIPEYVLMLCIRQDDEQVVETIFLPAAEVVRTLPASTVRILQQPLFTVKIEDTLTLDPLPSNTIPEMVPILVAPETKEGQWKIYYDSTFMAGTDTASSAALAELNAIAESLSVPIKLKTGDILVWKNHVAAHDRRY